MNPLLRGFGLRYRLMIKPPLPENESERLKALIDAAIMDTPPEEAFDKLAKLAAQICGTEFSVIGLIDENRQWYKAKFGLDATEAPRELTFCAHTLKRKDILEVYDASTDERFKGNPAVTGEPNIRFYAGAPLIDSNGFNLGTLCVFDSNVKSLENFQKEALKTFAKKVIELIEARKIK